MNDTDELDSTSPGNHSSKDQCTNTSRIPAFHTTIDPGTDQITDPSTNPDTEQGRIQALTLAQIQVLLRY